MVWVVSRFRLKVETSSTRSQTSINSDWTYEISSLEGTSSRSGVYKSDSQTASTSAYREYVVLWLLIKEKNIIIILLVSSITWLKSRSYPCCTVYRKSKRNLVLASKAQFIRMHRLETSVTQYILLSWLTTKDPAIQAGMPPIHFKLDRSPLCSS